LHSRGDSAESRNKTNSDVKIFFASSDFPSYIRRSPHQARELSLLRGLKRVFLSPGVTTQAALYF
jgi:hypothetical protein